MRLVAVVTVTEKNPCAPLLSWQQNSLPFGPWAVSKSKSQFGRDLGMNKRARSTLLMKINLDLCQANLSRVIRTMIPVGRGSGVETKPSHVPPLHCHCAIAHLSMIKDAKCSHTQLTLRLSLVYRCRARGLLPCGAQHRWRDATKREGSNGAQFVVQNPRLPHHCGHRSHQCATA